MNDNMLPGTPPQIAAVAVKELRFVVADNGGVKTYVHCKTNEGIIGVDGWHFKMFPPGMHLDMIIALMFTKDPFVKWPLGKPDPESPAIMLDNLSGATVN